MSLNKLYPLKFEPILQPKVWGGDLLHRYLNKENRSVSIGESWEISDVENFHSIIQNGEAQGMTLHELIHLEGERILGEKAYATFGDDFPLLIKFLDARVPLSVQVHPDDKWAKILENGQGKTEMWYILHAEKDASIHLGWKRDMSPEEIEEAISGPNVLDYLQKFVPKKGDVFFVPSTTVHSIGKGVVLAEIQQTSDITYRLYDFERKENGVKRELHIEKGRKVLNQNKVLDLKKEYQPIDNQLVEVVRENFFSMKFLSLKGEMELKTDDVFQVFICVSGQANFYMDDELTPLQQGETLLIPAAMQNYAIQSSQAELLCVSM